MRIRLTAACLIASTLLGTPLLASAAPTQSAQYRLTLAEAAGSVDTGSTTFSFVAKSYVDMDGNRGGEVTVDSFDFFTGFRSIQCVGAEFAGAVTVNQSTGASSVDATLDPASPSCQAVNHAGPALVLRVGGAFNAAQRTSQSGSVTEQQFGAIFKFNYQEDRFSSSFTGSTGFYTGGFEGFATSGRSSNRTRVK